MAAIKGVDKIDYDVPGFWWFPWPFCRLQLWGLRWMDRLIDHFYGPFINNRLNAMEAKTHQHFEEGRIGAAKFYQDQMVALKTQQAFTQANHHDFMEALEAIRKQIERLEK